MYSLDLVTVCKYADARYYFDDGVKALHTFSLGNNVINNDMVSKIIKNLYGETFLKKINWFYEEMSNKKEVI